MNESDLRDLLPAERRLSPARRRDMEERLMEQITRDVKVGRRRYRLVVGAVAAALLLVIGVVVLSAGDGESGSTGTAEEGEGEGAPREGTRWAPIPEEAAAARARFDVYGGGGVPYLASSEVNCAPPEDVTGIFVEGPGAPAMVALASQPSNVALEQPLTMDDIVASCTSDVMREGVSPEDADIFAAGFATACVAGSTERPGAVVALAGLTCEEAAGAGLESPRPMTEDDLAKINRMRAIDIAAMAMPEVCVTRDSAKEWLEAIVAEEGLDIAVEPAATDEELVEQAEDLFSTGDVEPADLCFYGSINWGLEPLSASVYALPPNPSTDYGPPVDITP